jgi:hypothetical protein
LGRPRLFFWHIKSVLKNAGIVVVERSPPTRWPFGEIDFLSRTRVHYKEGGHYRLKTKRGWMDPWVNYKAKPRKGGLRSRIPWGSYPENALIPPPR